MNLLSKYQGKDLIATIGFNRNFGYEENSLIYVYPYYLITKDGLERVDSDDFPTRGCFEARLYGGFTVQKILEGYGDVVVIRINSEPTNNIRGNNLYSFKFNPEFGKARSEIWIEEFKGVGLYQILNVNQSYASLEQTRRIRNVLDFIYTNQILVQDNYKIYGPFDFVRDATNPKDLILLALESNDYLVGEYSLFELEDNLIEVRDLAGRVCSVMVPKDRVFAPEKKQKNFDWVEDQVIIDLFVNMVKAEYGYDSRMLSDVRDLISRIGNSQSLSNITITRLNKLKNLAKQATINQLIFKNNLASIFNDPSLLQGMEKALSLKQDVVESAAQKYDQIKGLTSQTQVAEEKFEDLFSLDGHDSSYYDNNHSNKPKPLKEQLNNLFSSEKLLHDSNDVNKGTKLSPSADIKASQAVESAILSKLEAMSSDFVKISELTMQNEHLKVENEHFKDKDELYCNIEDLRKEKQDLNQSVSTLKKNIVALEKRMEQSQKDNAFIESSFEAKLSEYNDKANLAAKLIDSQLLDKIVRSVGGVDYQEARADLGSVAAHKAQVVNVANTAQDQVMALEGAYTTKVKFDTSLLSKDLSAKEIIHRVLGVIKDKAHRNVSYNDVANYLICLNQGFITTLAGEPGTGKTSLCILLAKALGLASNNESRRFVEIAVERGWTSHKDFIGYYNPLTKSMEKSNVEAFNAFERMSHECGDNINPYDAMQVAPYIVLLDEANLSPIEHYWAIFLKNCDVSSASQREISLGGNGVFHLPQHLRFLATVNFDHTTEELSPRYLDRSWVIYLDSNNLLDQIYDDDDELVLNVSDMVPYGSLNNAFAPKDSDVISNEVASKWQNIQDIFAHKGSMPIAPRNLKMVHNYCKVACRCMDLTGKTSALAPLDYAFCQKILPSINGSGENYQAMVEALAQECTEQSMPISAKHLMRMQRIAKNNMGFYQFFAR